MILLQLTGADNTPVAINMDAITALYPNSQDYTKTDIHVGEALKIGVDIQYDRLLVIIKTVANVIAISQSND